MRSLNGQGKKPYQKPTLEGEKVLEVSGQVCCRTSALGCTTAQRNAVSKTSKNTTTS